MKAKFRVARNAKQSQSARRDTDGQDLGAEASGVVTGVHRAKQSQFRGLSVVDSTPSLAVKDTLKPVWAWHPSDATTALQV